MKCKDCLSPKERSDVVYETKYWYVRLSPVQSYIGRCEIILWRHTATLSDVRKNEWDDLHDIIKTMERALRLAYKATMFNWGCFMNNAYQQKSPHPHVHWHCIPRYDHVVRMGKRVFADKEFGHHYNPTLIEDDDGRLDKISMSYKKTIIRTIRKYIS